MLDIAEDYSHFTEFIFNKSGLIPQQQKIKT